MSRALVLKKLREDTDFNALVEPQNVLSNYQEESPPSNLGELGFVILRWGEQNLTPVINRGPVDLTVWAHMPRKVSTDYTYLDSILMLAGEILCAIEDEAGEDGYSITSVWPAGGWSGDNVDPGFDTIVKTAPFNVLRRPT